MATNPWDAFPVADSGSPAPTAYPTQPASPGVIYGRPKQPAPQTPEQLRNDVLTNMVLEDRLKKSQQEERDRLKQEEALRQGLVDSADQLSRVIDAARDAKKLSREGWFATGFGAEASRDWFGGNAASDVKALLNTIGSNTAFDRLQKMRNESPTGGALGSVSEIELQLLRDSIASLEQSQSDEQFQASMDKVISAYQNVLNKISGAPAPTDAAEQQQGEANAPAGRVNDPAMIGDVPVGTQVEFGMDRWGEPDRAWNRESYLMEQYGISPNQEAQIQAFWNANRRNEDLTPQAVRQWYENNGLPSPDDTNLARMVAEAKQGFQFGLIDTSAAEAAALERLDNELDARNILPEDAVGTLGGGLAQGVTWGALDEITGLGGAVASALQGENPISGYRFERDLMRREQERGAAANPILSTVSEITGSLLTGGLGFRGVNNVRSATRAGAATGALAGFNYGEGPSGSLVGALGGGALGGAGAAGIQALAPRVGAATQFLRDRRAARNPEAGAIARLGEEFNVPVMTTDVRPPTTKAGTMIKQELPENIPIAGTGGMRARQQEARVQAVKDVVDEFGGSSDKAFFEATGDMVGDVAKSLSANRSARINSLSGTKNKIIDGIQGEVPLPNTARVIDEQIAKLRNVNEERLAPVIQELENWKGQLGGKSLRQLEENRKILGEAFSAPEMAALKSYGDDALNPVYGAMRQDMGDFIENSAGKAARNRWKNANDELSAMVGDLKSSTFKNVLRDTDMTPESVGRLLFSQKPSDVARLMENLDATGKRKAQGAVIQRMFERSISPDSGLSPERFLSAIRSSKETLGVTFTGRDLQRVEGLARVLDATRRASTATGGPQTGIQNRPILLGIGAGSVLSAGALVPVAISGGLLARIYESPSIRNALIGLARSKKGSADESRYLGRVIRSAEAIVRDMGGAANDAVARSPGRAAAQDEGDSGQVVP